MVKRHSNVVIRKVNIKSWQSEAANQARQEFGLNAIPHVRVIGVNGGVLGESSRIAEIEKAVAKEGVKQY